jgi:hypothetical protein
LQHRNDPKHPNDKHIFVDKQQVGHKMTNSVSRLSSD